MVEKKHALLLFTKAPKPGLTKTRLTKTRGGIFTPEEAASLYCASLLDVIELGFRALTELNEPTTKEGNPRQEQYEFIISCSPPSEQDALKELLSQANIEVDAIGFIADQGKCFDEHFDNAFQQLFEREYHSVVAIGGDLPTMPTSHIVNAFHWLDYFEAIHDNGGLVLAPCQECGVSLVGYTANTPMDSSGVFYNPAGIPALDAYIAKAKERRVPLALLDPVADFDEVQDLAHICSLIRAIAYSSQFHPNLFVPHHTLAWIERIGLSVQTPPNPEHDPREHIDARD
jgi:glycosyltransferase A (GT-A) superfamily protein (DUF2064 family)